MASSRKPVGHGHAVGATRVPALAIPEGRDPATTPRWLAGGPARRRCVDRHRAVSDEQRPATRPVSRARDDEVRRAQRPDLRHGRNAAGGLVLQSRRGQPTRRARRTDALPSPLLRRSNVPLRRRPGRLRERAHAPRLGTGPVSRDLSCGGRRPNLRAGIPRALAHGALLPLRGRPARADLPGRRPSRAVGSRTGRGRHRLERAARGRWTPPAEGPPLVHVARPLDVLAWPLRRVHPRR